VGTVFGGVGATVYQDLYAPSFGQHEISDVPAFDVEAAKALLTEVGDVPPIEFHWPTGRYLLDDQVGQAVVGMLENAGFEVNGHPMEFGAFLDLLLAGNMPGLFMIGNQSQYHHQSYNLNSYFLPTSVISYCSDPEIADQAEAALSLTGDESDAAYHDIAEKLVVEEACPVSLYLQNESWGVSGSVDGFGPRADEALNLSDVTVGG
jgi:peptide/nickel transport system substrate-binding protein